ncbi:MAG TPA: hypothetical protein VMF08_08685 [Candidatus Sulfotelmatobacter sp.]|nr:hypothetical protein [Candidatus Sulfotelmatobacter sp.]
MSNALFVNKYDSFEAADSVVPETVWHDVAGTFVKPPPFPVITPAMNAWLWLLPMRIMLASAGVPGFPMSMFEPPKMLYPA